MNERKSQQLQSSSQATNSRSPKQILQQEICHKYGWSYTVTTTTTSIPVESDRIELPSRGFEELEQYVCTVVVGYQKIYHFQSNISEIDVYKRAIKGLQAIIQKEEQKPNMSLQEFLSAAVQSGDFTATNDTTTANPPVMTIPIYNSHDVRNWDYFWSHKPTAVGIDTEGNNCIPPILIQIAVMHQNETYCIIEAPQQNQKLPYSRNNTRTGNSTTSSSPSNAATTSSDPPTTTTTTTTVSRNLQRLLNDTSIVKVFCDNFGHKDKIALGIHQSLVLPVSTTLRDTTNNNNNGPKRPSNTRYGFQTEPKEEQKPNMSLQEFLSAAVQSGDFTATNDTTTANPPVMTIPIYNSHDVRNWDYFWSHKPTAVGIDTEGNNCIPPILIQIAVMHQNETYCIIEAPQQNQKLPYSRNNTRTGNSTTSSSPSNAATTSSDPPTTTTTTTTVSRNLQRLLNDTSIVKVFCDNFGHKDKIALGIHQSLVLPVSTTLRDTTNNNNNGPKRPSNTRYGFQTEPKEEQKPNMSLQEFLSAAVQSGDFTATNDTTTANPPVMTIPIYNSHDVRNWDYFWSHKPTAVGIDTEGNNCIPPILIQIAVMHQNETYCIIEAPQQNQKLPYSRNNTRTGNSTTSSSPSNAATTSSDPPTTTTTTTTVSRNLQRLLNDTSIVKVFCDNFGHKDKIALGIHQSLVLPVSTTLRDTTNNNNNGPKRPSNTRYGFQTEPPQSSIIDLECVMMEMYGPVTVARGLSRIVALTIAPDVKICKSSSSSSSVNTNISASAGRWKNIKKFALMEQGKMKPIANIFRDLSPIELQYAACDAYATLLVYNYLRAKVVS